MWHFLTQYVYVVSGLRENKRNPEFFSGFYGHPLKRPSQLPLKGKQTLLPGQYFFYMLHCQMHNRDSLHPSILVIIAQKLLHLWYCTLSSFYLITLKIFVILILY